VARCELDFDRQLAVSISAIAGLVLFNLWLLVVGNAVLFAIRGWHTWPQVARLLGLGYLLGVALVGVVCVWQLTVGIDLSLASILVTGSVIVAASTIAGRRLGRPFPTLRANLVLPSVSILSALFCALTTIYLEALFRSGRLAGLYEFDAWQFWVPKAKAIYLFGGLDNQFFRELPNPTYPPLIPAVEAMAFHFMGSTDVVTLHLQFWFLLVGFVAAVAGVLAPRVPALVLWPPLLLVLVTPHVVDYALQPQADFLLDELLAASVLLIALWLREGANWMLVASTPLLAASMLTKREGYMFAACVLLAALLVTARRRHECWKGLFLVGVVAVAATVPWRVVIAVRGLHGPGSDVGQGNPLAHLDRVWPSLRLALATLFDFDIWLVVVPLLVVAVVIALARGARVLPLYVLLFAGLCLAGLTWSTWAFPTFPITKDPSVNPIVRLTGGLTLAAVPLIPLLLAVKRPGQRT
jgi:hypothetical protein